ncbi:MAG: hypothetical protein WC635_11555 [Bacteriovorax sp.]|jgi:hypothetical protein
MNSNKLIFLFTLFFSHALLAGDCEKFNISKDQLENVFIVENIPEEILSHYQQTVPMEKDLVGDFSLLKKGMSTPKKIFWSVKGDSSKAVSFAEKISSGKACAHELFPKIYGEEKQSFLAPSTDIRENDLLQIEKMGANEDQKNSLVSRLKAGKIYFEGHVNPIKKENFVLMVNQIILDGFEKGISPKRGTIHDWSDEFKNSDLAKSTMFSKMSKLLVALARGETSQYLLSGTEKKLEEWILQKELNSIYLHDMLSASYQINDGDMYLTLLTIENVLNRYWRIGNRENLPITRRLRPIINSFGSNGDTFGSWYHLFGMILYGYAEGSLSAKTIGTVETIGSHILGKFEDEKQEDFINSTGGVVGGRIARSIRHLKFDKMKSDSNRLKADYYLNLNEDFSERLKSSL